MLRRQRMKKRRLMQAPGIESRQISTGWSCICLLYTSFILLAVPSFVAKDRIDFAYGSSEIYGDASTQIGADAIRINEAFGRSNQIVCMVPVSYTHLDVYKRQADRRAWRSSDNREYHPCGTLR